MKKSIFLTLLLATCSNVIANGPWKLSLHCKEEKINLKIDLYEESIEVPGMDMFGPMNGYMNGNIYGVWTITSFKIIDDKKATFKISNDLGSETQKVSLTQQNDSIWTLRFEDGNVVKRAVKNKLVKIPSELQMTKNQ